VDEPAGSDRETELLGYSTEDAGLRFYDLRRSGPGGYLARRQLISLPSGTWAVLDSARDGKGRATEEVWRTSPKVAIQRLGEGSYRLRHGPSGARLRVWLGGAATVNRAGGPGAEGIRGMVMADKRPTPTSSLVVRRPSDGRPHFIAWARSAGAGSPRLASWKEPEEWRLLLPGPEGLWRLERKGARMKLVGPSGEPAHLELEGGPEVEEAGAGIRAAVMEMARAYGGFRALVSYRIKVTWLTGGLFLVHIGGFLLLYRLLRGSRLAALLVLSGWAAYVFWLRVYYFIV